MKKEKQCYFFNIDLDFVEYEPKASSPSSIILKLITSEPTCPNNTQQM
jgi:hypothetical protein